MIQVIAPLLPTWEIQTESLVPGFCVGLPVTKPWPSQDPSHLGNKLVDGNFLCLFLQNKVFKMSKN